MNEDLTFWDYVVETLACIVTLALPSLLFFL